MRLTYEMTQAQLDKLMESMKPVPAIMLHIPSGLSPQERANMAWAALGDELGFDHMTVEPAGTNMRFFSAVPRQPISA
jgi:hypothetical protein